MCRVAQRVAMQQATRPAMHHHQERRDGQAESTVQCGYNNQHTMAQPMMAVLGRHVITAWPLVLCSGWPAPWRESTKGRRWASKFGINVERWSRKAGRM